MKRHVKIRKMGASEKWRRRIKCIKGRKRMRECQRNGKKGENMQKEIKEGEKL